MVSIFALQKLEKLYGSDYRYMIMKLEKKYGKEIANKIILMKFNKYAPKNSAERIAKNLIGVKYNKNVTGPKPEELAAEAMVKSEVINERVKARKVEKAEKNSLERDELALYYAVINLRTARRQLTKSAHKYYPKIMKNINAAKELLKEIADENHLDSFKSVEDYMIKSRDYFKFANNFSKTLRSRVRFREREINTYRKNKNVASKMWVSKDLRNVHDLELLKSKYLSRLELNIKLYMKHNKQILNYLVDIKDLLKQIIIAKDDGKHMNSKNVFRLREIKKLIEFTHDEMSFNIMHATFDWNYLRKIPGVIQPQKMKK
jgi:hypothetical protein